MFVKGATSIYSLTGAYAIIYHEDSQIQYVSYPVYATLDIDVCLNSLVPGWCDDILKLWFLNLSYRTVNWDSLGNCSQVNATVPGKWEVNIGSGDGLVSSGISYHLRQCHMIAIGHNELMCSLPVMLSCTSIKVSHHWSLKLNSLN